MNNSIRLEDILNYTAWSKEKRDVSTKIREALVTNWNGEVKKNFFNYCNGVKSLLVLYNFGDLDISNKQDYEKDKNLIREGVAYILDYIGDGNRYELLKSDDYDEIFKDDKDDNKYNPVILVVSTVYTMLTFLRRAMKRKDLFTVTELNQVGYDLYQKVVNTVGDIMTKLLDHVWKNNFSGWGFTLNSERVTLNDTYAVVDAISRYEDAFTQEGVKNDSDFTNAVDAYGAAHGFEGLTDKLISAMCKVAYNVYDRTREVYGQSIFYADGDEFTETGFDQISSSNRSSALFNPLYVALITMYGYNDKELVIRRFMDDPKIIDTLYRKYEYDDKNKTGKHEISAYSQTLSWYKGRDFEKEVQLIKGTEGDQRKRDVSGNYDLPNWRDYYDIARVFQKFLETEHKDELRAINEYRDYFNATKDAIDQVQVMYRKFDDRQRLGIVDTDYVMFTRRDLDTASVNISKLNKANIAVNNLRPLLLSAKVLIVSALIKYPQSDISDLYEAIKASKHKKSTKSKKGGSPDEWLWNEDGVDMNSTARHCEAIAYDYFDYYEKFELGFLAVSKLTGDMKDAVIKNICKEDGSLNEEGLKKSAYGNSVKELIINVTRSNLEVIKANYQNQLVEREETFKDELEKKEKIIRSVEKDKNDLIDSNELRTASLKADTEISYTFKKWIKEEIDSYLTNALSYIVLHKINDTGNMHNMSLEKIKNGRVYDGDFTPAHDLLEKMKSDAKNDAEQANKNLDALKSRGKALQELIELAFADVWKSNELYNDIRNVRNGSYGDDLQEKNRTINKMFGDAQERLKTEKSNTDKGENK